MAMRVRQVVGDIYIADRWYTVDDTSHLPVVKYEREGVPPESTCAICSKPFSKHGWIAAPVDPDVLAAQYDPITGKAVPKPEVVNPPAEYPRKYIKGSDSLEVTNAEEKAKATAAGYVEDPHEAVAAKPPAPAKVATFPKSTPAPPAAAFPQTWSKAGALDLTVRNAEEAKVATAQGFKLLERPDANGLPICPGMYVLKSPLGYYSTCKASEFSSTWAETN